MLEIPHFRFETPSEAYLATLQRLLRRPEYYCSPRGQFCWELVDYYFNVVKPVSTPIVTHDRSRNKLIAKYHEAEKTLYLNGELRADVWAANASKFWAELANPDGTINSNYGFLALHNKSLPNNLTPWEWAVESLKKDPDSRQAYVRLSLPSHQWFGNKDQVCTMHVNFLIRDGELRATTVIRSNDAVRGLVYDMPWFIFLQERMAAELGIGVGIYGHFAHSMHVYERDIDKLKSMLGQGE